MNSEDISNTLCVIVVKLYACCVMCPINIVVTVRSALWLLVAWCIFGARASATIVMTLAGRRISSVPRTRSAITKSLCCPLILATKECINWILTFPGRLSLWIMRTLGPCYTWASCQIRKIAGCACAGNAGNVFPADAGQRSRQASRHVHDARAVMHAGIAN